MIGLTSHHPYYFYAVPTDMRKGFDGLSGLVTSAMGMDPMNGSVYLFINRRRDRMKLLVWESGGFMLYYKRLERGTFELPKTNATTQAVHLSWETFVLLFSGISLQSVRTHIRYKRA